MSRKAIDLTGLRFGLLTVLERGSDRLYGPNKFHRVTWLCLCDCGNKKEITAHLLKDGTSRSCGCIVRNRMARLNLTHGRTKSLAYKILNGAKQRAKEKGLDFNLELDDIKVPEICPLLGIEIKPRSQSRYSPVLDRVDNSKGYTKDNVWVISNKANLIKSNLTIDQMKTFVKNWEERVDSK